MRRLFLLIMVAVVGLSFIGFIIWFLILRDPTVVVEPIDNTNTTEVTDNTSTVPAPAPVVIPTPAPEAQPAVVERATIEALAKAFAERYSSYSTESNFSNITDLYSQMTTSFATKSQQDVAIGQSKPPATTFSATIARAIKVDLVNFDPAGGTAKAEVMLQIQQLTSASDPGTVSYQTMVLTMIKVDTAWKVDSAKLQPK